MKFLLFVLLLRIWAYPTKVPQGGFFRVNLVGQWQNVAGCFLGDSLAFIPHPQGSYTFGVVIMNQEPGEYWIKLNLDDQRDSILITVTPVEFKEECITVPVKMAVIDTVLERRVKEERERIINKLQQLTPELLWDGGFIRPVPGIVTSPFGAKRVFSGVTKSRHRGVDFKAGLGEEIMVTNKGKVVLTDNQYLLGKCVLVDHGYNLYTLYGHLDTILVNEGDLLKKGDVVGLSGNTGRSTAPHLHFGIYLYVHPFDPFSLF